MSEIPEDIKQAAREVAVNIGSDSIRDDSLTIALAILAERQRCADAAQKEADGFIGNNLPQAAFGCIIVRKAITNPVAAPPPPAG